MDFINWFFTIMSPLEIVGAVLGIINVYLITRRNILNWPVGIVMTILYTWIFFDAKLYSDVLTQVFFTVVQVVGWYQWQRVKEDTSEIKIVDQGLTEFFAVVFGTVVLSWAVGWFMATYTDAAYPHIDALILAASVSAQFLLNFRRAEAWFYWIFVDLVAIPLYYVKGLYPTTVLYVIFLGLAIKGALDWYRALHEGQKEDAETDKLVKEIV